MPNFLHMFTTLPVGFQDFKSQSPSMMILETNVSYDVKIDRLESKAPGWIEWKCVEEKVLIKKNNKELEAHST